MTQPPMTMLEKAARALCVSNGLNPDGKFKSSADGPEYGNLEYAWEEFLPDVRAVLKAVREPDVELPDDVTQDFVYPDDIAMGFTAMIDHILSEGAKG